MRRALAAWPGRGRMALALLCGVVAALGQAPWDLWYLALPALSLLIWLLSRQTVGGAIWMGWFAGAAYFGAAMFWIVEPFLVDAARDGWMAPFALLFLSFGMALFWALGAGLGRWLGGALAIAVALTATELLRSYVLTGFPWALIGHVWIATPVAQLAALGGPVGLTALTLAVAALPVAGRRWGVALSVVVIAAAWGWGQWRLNQPEGDPQPVTVRIVQPNAAQHLKWDPEMSRVYFRRLLEMTADRAGTPPDLILWPETAVNFLLEDEVGIGIIAEAAAGTPVALGIQRREGDRFYNSLAVIGADGAVGPVYDKHHLVPFGEYVPFGDTMSRFGIHGFASQAGQGYSSGPGPALMDIGAAGRILPLICYEAVFPQDLRVAARPDWILQATNDAWFGQLVGPYQHLAQARLRAIEQGLPLLRAANTGVSAVIDARGGVVTSLGLDTYGYLDAAVPATLPATPYSRSGDWPVTLIVLLGFVTLTITRFRKTR